MTDIFKLLLEVTLFSSAMILVVLSIKAVCGKRIGIRLISVLWMLVLVRLILPITFESPVHLISTTQENVSEAALKDSTVEGFNNQNHQNQNMFNNSEAVQPESLGLAEQTKSLSVGTEAISSPTNFQQIWTFLKAISVWTYAFILWVIGAVILLARYLVQMIVFSSKVRKCGQTDNADLNSMLMQNKAVLGIDKTVCIAECSSVDMPVTLGIIKPKILIPKGYVSTISRTQLSLMIMHELCHIKRNDVLKNYLWLFAKIIHWFNPLVLFAFKVYRDDIEIACDEMVLRYASEESRFEYSQGLLEALKLSRNEIKTPAALSFCKDRTKLRERVETMIKPKRKSKTAAVTAVLMATVMVLACFTTACQPTPEEPIVQTKDNDNVLDTIAQYEPQDGQPSVINTYSAPKTWQGEVHDEAKTIDINVDAKVIVPTDTWGIYQLTTIAPDRAFVNGVINTLIGEADMYVNDTYLSRDELLQEFESNEDNEIEIYAHADIGRVELASVSLHKLSSGVIDIRFGIGCGGNGGFSCRQPIDDQPLKGITTSQEEAANIAWQAAKDMGFDYLDIAAVHKMEVYNSNSGGESDCYAFTFTRGIDGIPATYAYWAGGMTDEELLEYELEYARQWHVSEMLICIDDSGVILAEINVPKSDITTLAQGIKLRSFEQIMEIFNQQVIIEGCFADGGLLEQIVSRIIIVDEIRLGYMPTIRKDHPDEIIYVPVWDFFGSETITYDENYENKESSDLYASLDQNFQRTINLGDQAILTINALDGTLMRRLDGSH